MKTITSNLNDCIEYFRKDGSLKRVKIKLFADDDTFEITNYSKDGKRVTSHITASGETHYFRRDETLRMVKNENEAKTEYYDKEGKIERVVYETDSLGRSSDPNLTNEKEKE